MGTYFVMQLEACAHPFFDELRDPNGRLPNGRPFPPLFNFKQEVSRQNIILCQTSALAVNYVLFKTKNESEKNIL